VAPAEPQHQLPPDVDIFVGREQELRSLERIGAARLVVLVGPPGVGKTALAVRWAHRMRDRYPDGALYADLGGRRAGTLERTLERFLRALGLAAQHIPVELAEQAALFRRLTADVQLLLLLDNAGSATEVRSISPAAPGSMTLVTGPSRLGSLAADGARFVELGPLTRRDGLELLARSVGVARIDAEPAPARQLVSLCGGLPLALCVAGARLAIRPRWTVQETVSDLVDERRRLARLSFASDLSVQAVFDVSYQALSAPAAHLYRLLGLHPGPDFDTGVAAAMVGLPLLDTEGLLDELLNTNLLEAPRAGRCRFHELIRLHARQRAEAEESAEARALAVHRMLDWYLHAATLAGRLVTPHRTESRRDVEHAPVEPMSFRGHAEALDWLDRECANLLAAARYAHEHDLPAKAWQLADAMWGLFLFHTRYQDWLQFDQLAVRAAERCADPAMEAESQDRLGLLFHALGRNDDALRHMTRATDLWRRLGRQLRLASSLERFGFAYLDQGRLELAIDHFTRALAAYRDLGEQRGTGLALISLGRALLAANRVPEAVEALRTARRELESLPVPDPYNVARSVIALARAQTRAGQPEQARQLLTSALTTMRTVSSPLGQADALWALAELHEQTGNLTQARSAYEQTATLFTDLGNPATPQIRARLHALGRSDSP
jgi:tetratricopeptide (TPR) repeat protein